MTERTCEQCGNSFMPKAPHQRFDYEECRYQHCVEKSVQEANQRVEEGARRASRDGKGTKVYLTFGELVHLQGARNFQKVASTPLGDRLDAKLDRAIERVAA